MKIGTYYQLPIPLYWAFKRQAFKWEEPLHSILKQALDQFIIVHDLKSIDWLKENPKQLSKLLTFTGVRSKKGFKMEKTIGFSTTPELGLSIHILSLQMHKSKIDTLIEIISEFLTSINAPLQGEPINEQGIMDLIFQTSTKAIPKTFEELNEGGHLEEGKSYSEGELQALSKQLKKVQTLILKGGEELNE